MTCSVVLVGSYFQLKKLQLTTHGPAVDPDTPEKLSGDDLVAQIGFILIAGQETTVCSHMRSICVPV
jgi:hypothetical protein